eukprot:1145772-Pelagomonas_calceolata.AAC.1
MHVPSHLWIVARMLYMPNKDCWDSCCYSLVSHLAMFGAHYPFSWCHSDGGKEKKNYIDKGNSLYINKGRGDILWPNSRSQARFTLSHKDTAPASLASQQDTWAQKSCKPPPPQATEQDRKGKGYIG